MLCIMEGDKYPLYVRESLNVIWLVGNDAGHVAIGWAEALLRVQGAASSVGDKLVVRPYVRVARVSWLHLVRAAHRWESVTGRWERK